MKLGIGLVVGKVPPKVRRKFLENLGRMLTFIDENRITAILASNFEKELNEVSKELSECFNFDEVHTILITSKKPSGLYVTDREYYIAQSREEIRKKAEELGLDYLFYLDMDMEFEENALKKLLEIARKERANIVQNAYLAKHADFYEFTGFGLTLLDSEAIKKIRFKIFCKRPGKPPLFSEAYAIYLAYKKGLKVIKGIFVRSKHYIDEDRWKETIPRELTLWERITNSPLAKRIIYGISLLFGYSLEYVISWKAHERRKRK